MDHQADPWLVRPGDFPEYETSHTQLNFLIRYAILAPSSHNTQPWRFSVHDEEILLFADKSRWLKIADADERELHISLGCALENLLIAARHFGYSPHLTYFPLSENPDCFASVRLGLRQTAAAAPGLFEAIALRSTNHKVYDGRPVSEDTQQRIKESAEEPGIPLLLSADTDIKRQVEELIVRADTLQFADPAFRAELGYWIGQGVFGTAWLISKLGELATTYVNIGASMARKDSGMLMSAPLLGLICSTNEDRVSQVKTGQVLERVYLAAHLEGLSLQPMSQLCQVPEVKARLARLIPRPGLHPQQPFRLGYAEPESAHTPRRPLEEVLV